MLSHDTPFRWPFAGSLEQSSRPGESRLKHQAIVVWPHRASNLVASGSEHVEMRSSVIELIAFLFDRDFHSRSLRLRNDREQGAYWPVDTQPELPRMEIGNHRRHSAEVISMRMRDRDHIETIEASIPKIRRDHLFADIKVRMHPLRQASGINEESAASGVTSRMESPCPTSMVVISITPARR